jgi:cysteine desulfurase/selenocysteine lyase
MNYKKDFPFFKINKNLVYLDSAATSQKPEIVITAVNDFYQKFNSNIHRGIYGLSLKAEELYESTRQKVADFIGAFDASEIIFTGNTTESINLAAFGYFRKNLSKGDIVVLSEMEHHSNIVPWIKLKEIIGINIIYLPLTKDFQLDYKTFLSSDINFKKVKLISLTHASNVLGTVNRLEEIIPILKRKCTQARILVDAAQSIPHLQVNVKKFDCDFLAFSSHKMFGPSGLGVLYAKKEMLINMDPIFYGGHMISSVTKDKVTFADAPQKFEAGTGKLEAVVGLGAAIDFLLSLGIKNVQKYEDSLTQYTISKISKIKTVQVYGPISNKYRLPVFSFNIANIHPHDVSEILNRKKICVRTGHHCCQILMDSLHLQGGTVRASLSIYNTTQDIDKLIEGIEEVKKIFKM